MTTDVSTPLDLTERTKRLALQNAINRAVFQLTYVCRAIRNYEGTTDAERAADGGFGLVLLRRMLEGVLENLNREAADLEIPEPATGGGE